MHVRTYLHGQLHEHLLMELHLQGLRMTKIFSHQAEAWICAFDSFQPQVLYTGACKRAVLCVVSYSGKGVIYSVPRLGKACVLISHAHSMDVDLVTTPWL